MPCKLLSIFLLLLCCTTAFAQDKTEEKAGAKPVTTFDAFVSGNVRTEDFSITAGLAVTVTPDEFYGVGTKRRLEQLKSVGKLAEYSVAGKGVTDIQGNFLIKVTVTLTGEVPFPVSGVRIDNQIVFQPYAFLSVTVAPSDNDKRAGHVECRIQKGQETPRLSMAVSKPATVTGVAIDQSNRKPLSGVALKFQGWTYQRDQWGRRKQEGEPVSVTTVTDKDGCFVFSGKDIPISGTIYSVDDTWAVDLESSVRGGIQVQAGKDNDVGFVPMVKAGSVAFNMDESNSGDAPTFKLTEIQRNNNRNYQNFTLQGNTGEPVTKLVGLPPAWYELVISNIEDCFDQSHRINIEAGDVVDLGKIERIVKHRLTLHVNLNGEPVKRFTATARLAKGEKWAMHVRRIDQYGRRSYETRNTLTIEQPFLNNLYKGRWVVSVKAEGAAQFNIEVDVPSATPVVIELKQGGNACLIIEGERNSSRYYYVKTASPDHFSNELAIKERRFNDLKITNNISGQGEMNYDGKINLVELPEGEYILFYQTKGLWMSGTFTVKSGETTNHTFKPKKYKISLTCLMDGKPYAGEQLILINAISRHGEAKINSRGNTGKNGVAEFSDLEPGNYLALTSAEWEWLTTNRGFNRNTEAARIGRFIEVHSDSKVLLELHDNMHQWVKVNVELPTDPNNRQNRWTLSLAQSGKNVPFPIRLMLTMSGDVSANFGPMPTGEYLAVFTFNSEIAAEKTLTITKDNELYDLAWEWHKLTLTLPQSNNNSRERYNIRNIIDEKGSCGSYSKDVSYYRNGVIEFKSIAAGKYEISCMQNDKRIYEIIDVQGDVSKTLEYKDKTGTLEIIPSYPIVNDRRGPMFRGHTRILLFDVSSKSTMPTLTVNADIEGNATLAGIPAGTYSIRFENRMNLGELANFKVIEGKTTSIKCVFTPKGKTAYVFLNNVSGAIGLTVDVKYFDKDKKIIDAEVVFAAADRWQRDVSRIILERVPDDAATAEVHVQGFEPYKVKFGSNGSTRADLVRELGISDDMKKRIVKKLMELESKREAERKKKEAEKNK